MDLAMFWDTMDFCTKLCEGRIER